MWNEANILTAIGAASRIDYPSSLPNAAWAEQQYKILNLLRWVRGAFIYNSDFEGKSVLSSEKTSWAAAESEAQSLFAAASWSALGLDWPRSFGEDFLLLLFGTGFLRALLEDLIFCM